MGSQLDWRLIEGSDWVPVCLCDGDAAAGWRLSSPGLPQPDVVLGLQSRRWGGLQPDGEKFPVSHLPDPAGRGRELALRHRRDGEAGQVALLSLLVPVIFNNSWLEFNLTRVFFLIKAPAETLGLILTLTFILTSVLVLVAMTSGIGPPPMPSTVNTGSADAPSVM